MHRGRMNQPSPQSAFVNSTPGQQGASNRPTDAAVNADSLPSAGDANHRARKSKDRKTVRMSTGGRKPGPQRR